MTLKEAMKKVMEALKKKKDAEIGVVDSIETVLIKKEDRKEEDENEDEKCSE